MWQNGVSYISVFDSTLSRTYFLQCQGQTTLYNSSAQQMARSYLVLHHILLLNLNPSAACIWMNSHWKNNCNLLFFSFFVLSCFFLFCSPKKKKKFIVYLLDGIYDTRNNSWDTLSVRCVHCIWMAFRHQ